VVKEAAATANRELGRLSPELATLIIEAAREVASGSLDDHFPLVVFQTGSGTHTNMNANEVIANRGNELAGTARGSKSPVHPNDHVNMSQSSNDVFPTVMHLTTVLLLHRHLYPALDELRNALSGRAERFRDIVKVGRTHLQDAAPVTMGQEVGGWVAQLDYCGAELRHAERSLLGLAIGGTAVGTGLNSPADFGPRVAALLAAATGIEFTTATDRFAALSAHDAMVSASGSLRTLAGALMKIATTCGGSPAGRARVSAS
jgi:fumarate hydratase class II